MNKAYVMLRSRKRAGGSPLDAIILRHRITPEHTRIDPDTVSAIPQNGVLRYSQKSEPLLQEPGYGR